MRRWIAAATLGLALTGGVLSGCGGGGSAEPPSGGKVSQKAFDAGPCNVLSADALVNVIKPLYTEVDLPPLRTSRSITRFAGDFSHCRYVLVPKEKELDGIRESSVTVYNEQDHGAALMRACRDRPATSPTALPAIGDESCLDALGQVRVRLGARYFSVVADLVVETPDAPVAGRLTNPSTAPAPLTPEQQDTRNAMVARAVAVVVAERLRP